MNQTALYELKHRRAEMLKHGEALLVKKDFEGHKALMLEIDKLNLEIDAAEKQLAEEGRFDDDDAKLKQLAIDAAAKGQQEKEMQSLDALRGSNLYAQSFAKAMRHCAKPSDYADGEALAPLYKALTESGGTPKGADGGFLVPIDFDNTIIRLQRDYFDLSALFRVESVNTQTGWRVVETGLPTAMPLVAEMGTIGKTNQPKFARVDYSVKTYADRVAISGELMDDNAAGLLAYVSEWFAPKYVMTKNQLLLSFLKAIADPLSLTAGEEEQLLRRGLISRLNTAHARGAQLLTNQSGFAEMDGWNDTTGRALLVPNPLEPSVMRFRGKTVSYADDALLENEAGGMPIYVGNFAALATLFERKGIELATTNVGGDAWSTGSYELRAIARLDAQLVDKTAAFKALIPTTTGG